MSAPAGSEREWQETLTQALAVYGWATQHVYPLRTEHGWRTGTTAEGWPDLACFRGQWVIGLEVKGYKTRVDDEQYVWVERFAAIPTGRGWILRPDDDWRAINAWMRDPASAPRRFGWTQAQYAAALERIQHRARIKGR